MILRFSNILGESLLFFISLSILSILSISLFNPKMNLAISSAYATYEDGYKYGYKIDFLQKDSAYLYFLNSGRTIKNISIIYLDDVKYTGPVFILRNGAWQTSGHINKGDVFKIPYNSTNLTKLDLVVDGKYILHVFIGGL